jgi:hypothetical protein
MQAPIAFENGQETGCVTTALLVSVKTNTVFMRCSTDGLPLSAILCKPAHEQEKRDTSALGQSKN